MKHGNQIRIAAFAVLILTVLSAALINSRHAGAQVAVPDWRNKVHASLLAKAPLAQSEFLIYLAQRADLSGARNLATKDQKGRYVFERLAAAAQGSQPPVTRTLDQLRVEYKSFWVANVIWAKGNLAVIQATASLPQVAYITPSPVGGLDLPRQQLVTTTSSPSATNSSTADPNPEPALIKVNADDVWALGVLGQGVVVAGADTGVRWTHAALKSRYRGWNGTTVNHNYNWHDGIHNQNAVCPGSSAEPCDDDDLLGGGHGSHTVGTMVGDDGGDNRIGMAPQAKWIACRNMNHGVGAPVTGYLECMQWFLAPTDSNNQNPDPSKAPHVINNSWGCVEPGCLLEPNPPVPGFLRATLQASRAAGIFYVVSAGNDGQNGTGDCSTLQFPLARYPESFSVGATTYTTDLIADFSSRGAVLGDPDFPTGLRKPDISAPGVNIRSVQRASDTAYGSLSGTSMAGPHVAGLVALIISANPSLAGNVDRLEDIIEQTAVRKTTTQLCGEDTSTSVPNNVYGWGRIDALAAVNLARQGINTVPFNYALTSNGALPAASSSYSGGTFPAASAFDGERSGANWGQNGGWNDDTRDVWPDDLSVTFAGAPKAINEIRVYTVQNDFSNPVAPDENTDASLYGIEDFQVQTWNGSAWVTVSGGDVTGNTKALRVFTLATPVTTTAVRVVITNARSHFSRIVELEAFGLAGQ